MLPGKRDLNRCFEPPFIDDEGRLADSIKGEINALAPEFLIDIHNTSGSGPAFSVATSRDAANQVLSSYFCQRQIVTEIKLGSLMECEFGCPVITLEAGGGQDEHAHETAFDGLRHLLTETSLTLQRNVDVLTDPKRFELAPSMKICYDNQSLATFDMCIRPDIESFNSGNTPAGTELAKLTADAFAKLTVSSDNQVKSHFYFEGNALKTKQDLKLFMVTSNAEIALTDCLFYFVRV
jgi:hypothetical protein